MLLKKQHERQTINMRPKKAFLTLFLDMVLHFFEIKKKFFYVVMIFYFDLSLYIILMANIRTNK